MFFAGKYARRGFANLAAKKQILFKNHYVKSVESQFILKKGNSVSTVKEEWFIMNKGEVFGCTKDR